MPAARFGFLRAAYTIARKDLRVEARSREVLFTVGFFAVLTVFIFAFAFIRDGRQPGGIVPGMLWATIVFAGTLALSRAMDRERESNTMRALLLAPVSRTALFFGKTISIWLVVLGVAVVLVPLIAFLFGASLFVEPVALALLVVFGTLGFAIVGTVFSAMLLRARSRDVLLPIVLYPLLVPMLIATTRGTSVLLDERINLPAVYGMVQFVAAYDAIFFVVALWVFESVVIE